MAHKLDALFIYFFNALKSIQCLLLSWLAYVSTVCNLLVFCISLSNTPTSKFGTLRVVSWELLLKVNTWILMLAELQPARLNFTVMSTLIGNLCCGVLWLLLGNHLIVGNDLAPLNFENSRTLRWLPLTSRLILLAIGEANDLQFLDLTKRIAAPSYGSIALSNNFVKNLRHDLAGYLMPLLLL